MTKSENEVLSINPSEVSVGNFHAWLVGCIAPRPIAFVSTQDIEGNVNLSPFSFFNVFGSNPPLLVFSPSNRVRNNTPKHTLENAGLVPELVINVVNYPMVEQVSLASCEYDRGVNEFVKAGFTEAKSEKVKPPRVAESPAAFECIVRDILPYGNGGGGANLVICEVVLAHFRKEYLDENGKLKLTNLDLVGRLGADWYVRANANTMFEVAKPNQKLGIGFDGLPAAVRESKILSGNDLGKLANVEKIPEKTEISNPELNTELDELKNIKSGSPEIFHSKLHTLAKTLLDKGEINKAWQVLLLSIA